MRQANADVDSACQAAPEEGDSPFNPQVLPEFTPFVRYAFGGGLWKIIARRVMLNA